MLCNIAPLPENLTGWEGLIARTGLVGLTGFVIYLYDRRQHQTGLDLREVLKAQAKQIQQLADIAREYRHALEALNKERRQET